MKRKPFFVFVLGLAIVLVCFSNSVDAAKPKSDILYLKTQGGQKFELPVGFFRGLSTAVLSTLIKEGKAAALGGGYRVGTTVFYLSKGYSPIFADWAQSVIGHPELNRSEARFSILVDGQKKEKFIFHGLHLLSFEPFQDGTAVMIVIADRTLADPPLHFDGKH